MLNTYELHAINRSDSLTSASIHIDVSKVNLDLWNLRDSIEDLRYMKFEVKAINDNDVFKHLNPEVIQHAWIEPCVTDYSLGEIDNPEHWNLALLSQCGNDANRIDYRLEDGLKLPFCRLLRLQIVDLEEELNILDMAKDIENSLAIEGLTRHNVIPFRVMRDSFDFIIISNNKWLSSEKITSTTKYIISKIEELKYVSVNHSMQDLPYQEWNVHLDSEEIASEIKNKLTDNFYEPNSIFIKHTTLVAPKDLYTTAKLMSILHAYNFNVISTNTIFKLHCSSKSCNVLNTCLDCQIESTFSLRTADKNTLVTIKVEREKIYNPISIFLNQKS